MVKEHTLDNKTKPGCRGCMRAHRCSLLVSKLATLFEKRSHLHIHRSLQHWDFSPSAPLSNYATSAFIVPPLTTSLGG